VQNNYNIEATHFQNQPCDIRCLLLKKQSSLDIKKTSNETSIQDNKCSHTQHQEKEALQYTLQWTYDS